MTGVEDGWVYDVELAKKIILAHFNTSRYWFEQVYVDSSMEEWLDKVRNELQMFESMNFSIMREGGWFLGGPNGWSGFTICTLEEAIKEYKRDDIDLDFVNEDLLVVCEVDGDPTVFVLHESD